MKMIRTLAIGVGLSALTLSCMAQEDEDAPTNYIYSSYYYCGGGPLSRVDEITAEGAPVPAWGLQEAGLAPDRFARQVLESYCSEMDDLHRAASKVRGVP